MAQSAQIKKVNHWHERLCDWLIANPGAPQNEAAKYFQKTPAWISTVINSDAFQDYYRERSLATSNAVVVDLKAKMLGATDMAVSEIQRRLSTPQAMTTDELLAVTDTMSKRAMPAQASQGGPAVQQILIVSKDDLAAARAAMRQRFESRGSGAPAIAQGGVLEGEAVEVVSAGDDQ